MKSVVVVGSGLAGLSAGYRLREQGCHVTVFESLDRVGGRVLSESEDGFLFDVGPTIVTDNYTEYMKLVGDVGLTDKVVDCASKVAVVQGDNLHVLDTRKPLRAFLTTKLLPPAAKLRLMTRGLLLIKPLYRMNPYGCRCRAATFGDRRRIPRQIRGRRFDREHGQGRVRRDDAAAAQGVRGQTNAFTK